MSEYTPYDDEIVSPFDEWDFSDLDDRSVVDLGGGEEYFAEDRATVYCRHGKYIGYPGGPDYICPYCEDGANHEAFGLRYDVEVNWDATDPDWAWTRIYQCWSPEQFAEKLDTLRFLWENIFRKDTPIKTRVVVVRYGFWSTEPQDVEVPLEPITGPIGGS